MPVVKGTPTRSMLPQMRVIRHPADNRGVKSTEGDISNAQNNDWNRNHSQSGFLEDPFFLLIMCL